GDETHRRLKPFRLKLTPKRRPRTPRFESGSLTWDGSQHPCRLSLGRSQRRSRATVRQGISRAKPGRSVSITTPATAALQSETKTVPIVFAQVSDPVGSGFVASFARPGGNITGFVNIEASLSGKWLELMHRIAPSVSRVALLFNPQTEPYARY